MNSELWRISIRLAPLLVVFSLAIYSQPLDPRCGNRTATGQFDCTISQPNVSQRETLYSNIVFAPGDIVDIHADGCVQTGGSGDTWKRYVNPTGGDTDRLYHGLIRIPTGTKGNDLVRIGTVIGRHITVSGAGVPLRDLVLHLGYEDDDYSDNGYWGHDNGNDDQCKIDTARGMDGGPAHVTVTISRGVPPSDQTSRFDFDVLSSSVDPNGLPYNPYWSWQKRPENQGKIPDTSLCHQFSKPGSELGLPTPFLEPNFPDCTDQIDSNSVDLPSGPPNEELCKWGGVFKSNSFAGHVNWFPITVEGRAGWGDHGADDDYTFTFNNDQPGNPLSVNGRTGLHVEFDSDETVDHFSTAAWNAFHQAVDDDDKAQAALLFNGHTIMTGMFGLDGEHNMKSELHPLYAMATRREFPTDPRSESWLMFVRNLGDEGYCSSQQWDAGFTDYTFRLPWLSGMTSAKVNLDQTQFNGTDGTSAPVVAILPPPAAGAGVYVTFHLGAAASSPFVEGVLQLSWTGPSGPGGGTVRGVRLPDTAGLRSSGAAVSPPVDDSELDEAEHQIRAAINQVPAPARQSVLRARAIGGVRPVMHRLPPIGPVQTMAARSEARRIARPHAIKAGPATRKAARDAAQMKALCAATRNAPAGLPPSVCGVTVRDRR